MKVFGIVVDLKGKLGKHEGGMYAILNSSSYNKNRDEALLAPRFFAQDQDLRGRGDRGNDTHPARLDAAANDL